MPLPGLARCVYKNEWRTLLYSDMMIHSPDWNGTMFWYVIIYLLSLNLKGLRVSAPACLHELL